MKKNVFFALTTFAACKRHDFFGKDLTEETFTKTGRVLRRAMEHDSATTRDSPDPVMENQGPQETTNELINDAREESIDDPKDLEKAIRFLNDQFPRTMTQIETLASLNAPDAGFRPCIVRVFERNLRLKNDMIIGGLIKLTEMTISASPESFIPATGSLPDDISRTILRFAVGSFEPLGDAGLNEWEMLSQINGLLRERKEGITLLEQARKVTRGLLRMWPVKDRNGCLSSFF